MDSRKAPPTVTGQQRPTPLHPYPQSETTQKAGDEKAYPPELGTDAIAILEGRTFMLSNSLGDVPPGSIGGLLHNDTRFVSRWELTLAGSPLSLLKSAIVDYYSASFFLTNPDLPAAGLRANSIAVRRLRFVGNGVIEQIVAMNSAMEPVNLELRLRCGADFADLFEVKSVVRDRRSNTVRHHDQRALRFQYQVAGFKAATTISIRQSEIVDSGTRRLVGAAPPQIEGDEIVWKAVLEPRLALVTEIRVGLEDNGASLQPMHDHFGDKQEAFEGPLAHWLAECPRFESDSALLTSVF